MFDSWKRKIEWYLLRELLVDEEVVEAIELETKVDVLATELVFEVLVVSGVVCVDVTVVVEVSVVVLVGELLVDVTVVVEVGEVTVVVEVSVVVLVGRTLS